jgi:hypothetical protein
MHEPLNQRERRIDLPMRAFAGGFYSHLKAMYDYLAVGYHPQRFLFSFAKLENEPHGDVRPSPHFIHSSNNHRIPPIRPPQRGLLSWILDTIYITFCYTYFTLCCFLVPSRPSSPSRNIPSESLHSYLQRIRLPSRFVNDYLLPLMCSVATCPLETLLDFPAQDILEYKRRTQGAQHYVVSGGVHSVQKRLTKGLDMRFRTTVSKVEALSSGVRIRILEQEQDQTKTEDFDIVILAISPDIVFRIFEPLRYQMSQIPTSTVESVVQYDTLDPVTPASTDISNRNTAETETQTIHFHTRPLTKITTSHHSLLGQPPMAVTTSPNPLNPTIPESRILHRASFTRVLRTPLSRQIVNRIFDLDLPDSEDLSEPNTDLTPLDTTNSAFNASDEKQRPKPSSDWKNGDNNVWLVGGWCWDGMVLLEGCVVSAERAARGLGVGVPWNA